MDRRAFVSVAAGMLLAAPLAANAQVPAYPSKPIRLVVPFPPGAGTDTVARNVAQKLGESIKGTIVVDNRPGAGGAIGAVEVAKADPDGYTLLFVAGPFTTVAAASKTAGYDPVKQFAPVAPIATSPLVFVVNPAVPADTMREFISLAKREPGVRVTLQANPYFVLGRPNIDAIEFSVVPDKNAIVVRLMAGEDIPAGRISAERMVILADRAAAG